MDALALGGDRGEVRHAVLVELEVHQLDRLEVGEILLVELEDVRGSFERDSPPGEILLEVPHRLFVRFFHCVLRVGDENHAMQIMAKGASLLAARLHREGKFDGMIVLGGTMGTDLALDVASALPLGVPKYIVSTVSFYPLIPAERLAACLTSALMVQIRAI